MAMGTRKLRQRQEQLWVTHTELAEAPGHPFYKRLNELLDGEKFDEFCERECVQFYAKDNGRPSFNPRNLLPTAFDRVFRGDRF
jgi:hypothetical protein